MTELPKPIAGAAGAVVSPGSLICRVFNSFAELDHLRPAWDQACLRAGGSVYMTYDWVRVWWEFYGRGAELRLFVFFAGPVFLVP